MGKRRLILSDMLSHNYSAVKCFEVIKIGEVSISLLCARYLEVRDGHCLCPVVSMQLFIFKPKQPKISYHV